MAAVNQSFMFGDFDDLAPEEHQRIQNILHGYKEPSSKKVEFPWDDSSYGGAVAGFGMCFTSQELEFGGVYAEMPPYSMEVNPQDQSTQYQVEQQQEEFRFPENERERIEREQMLNQVDKTGSGDVATVGSPNPSKLQASLKTYERRNKKKRPPGYYSQVENDSSGSGLTHVSSDGNLQASMIRSEVHANQSDQPDGVHYSQNRQDAFEANVTVNDASRHQYNAPVYQNIQNVQYIQGAPELHTQNIAAYADIGVGAQYSANKMEDLNEVIVESVPYSNSHGRQEMDTKQIQDHDRTTVKNQPSSSVSDSSSLVHSSSVASDTNNVFVSKLQIPNLSAPSYRGEASVNDSMEYSTNSSQLSESFQPASQINEKLETNELPGDRQHGTDNIVNESYAASAIEADSKSVSGMEATAKDIVKPDIQNPPVTNAESLKPSSAPASAPAPAKPTTWAGLFKSSSATISSQPTSVPVVESGKEDLSASNKEAEERNEKEASPQPVPATEDKEAKQLGELLSKMTISHASVALQPRGLVNRANWCYINGTLQALIACPPFYNLLRKLPRYPALSRGPSSTPILDSLVEFVHEFPLMPKNLDKSQKKGVRDIYPGNPFEPSYVYKMLQLVQVNPHFKHGKQEDAEEFLSCILDGMHEEMKAAVTLLTKNNKAEPVVDGYTNGYVAGETDEDEEADPEAWEQVGPKKKSMHTRKAEFAKTPIAEIFAGMIRSVVYKASAKETATLQPFFTLQLDIQSEKVWTVNDALEGFVSKEPISGYTCPKTNTEVEIVKKVSLEELPAVLILHLKFFVYNKDGGSQKLMKKVDFPVELEITKDLLSPNARSKLSQQQRSYKLFAVVYHHGKTSTGGHYTTSVFHPGISGWIHIDDSNVKTVFVKDVLKYVPQRVPYLLYYRRVDSHSH